MCRETRFVLMVTLYMTSSLLIAIVGGVMCVNRDPSACTVRLLDNAKFQGRDRRGSVGRWVDGGRRVGQEGEGFWNCHESWKIFSCFALRWIEGEWRPVWLVAMNSRLWTCRIADRPVAVGSVVVGLVYASAGCEASGSWCGCGTAVASASAGVGSASES